MRWRPFLRLGLAAGALVVATAGCRVDTDVQLNVRPDGTGEVVVTVTADHDVVEAAPDLANDIRVDDLVASGWTPDGPTPTADGGLQLVLRHPFANVAEANAILTQLSGPNGPLRDLTLDVSGSETDVQWMLDGQLDFASGLSALADPALADLVGTDDWIAAYGVQDLTPAEAAGITFRAALPGTAVGPDGSTLPPGSTEYTVNAGDPPVDIQVRTLATSTEVRDAKELEDRMIRYLMIYGAVVLVIVLVWIALRWRKARRWT